ncbi:MAG: transaldolase [Chloroflexi bacterium]|nr:transaldolase [Chloroflexota bacterium]
MATQTKPATNAVQRAQALGQSIWLDFISREILRSGELARLILLGVSGVTSNPTIFEKSISAGNLYDQDLLRLAQEGRDALGVYEGLALKDIADAADLMRPVYDRANGADGFVSIEVDPRLAHDTEATVKEAVRLFGQLGRPNVLIKVPATPEGIPAIRTLIGRGINVNVTLIFSLDAYRTVANAYIDGLSDRARAGNRDLSRIASVASFFVSRLDSLVDKRLESVPEEQATAAASLKGALGIANAKLAYAEFGATFAGARFTGLARMGARPQRPLWASTSVKNPAYPDTLYLDQLMGPQTVNTVPPATLDALLDHGSVIDVLGKDVGGARQKVAGLKQAGISYEAVTAELLSAGVKAFADSFTGLLGNIEKKRAGLLAGTPART